MAKLSDRLRWEAERLPKKFSENDELFQLLTEAADEIDKKPEQKTGKWESIADVIWYCSECKYAHSRSNYCPHCGAKMEVEHE